MVSSQRAPLLQALVGAVVLGAAACGGGGGGGGTSPPPPPTGPAWTQNVFPLQSTFENRCAVVRTGVDAQNQPFPDQPGSLAQELFFLRSWTNKTYLWNTEVVDQNPNTFSDRTTYFNVLKTINAASSGKPKDQFHFTLSTADYLAQVTSAPTAGYGAEIKIFQGLPPRDVRVLYTQAGTPATDLLNGTPKLVRGTKLITVDGVDVINGANTTILNAGTFPTAAGQSHTLTVQYPDNSSRSITLVSANIVETPVNRSTVLTTASGKVGYILFNTFSPFSSEAALVNTIASLKAQGVNDVVLDMRYNGGGLLAVASQLSYMIAGTARTAGHTFERLQFNAAAGTSDPVTGGTNSPTPFYSTGLGFSVASGAVIQSLDLPRVYVLSTSSTCSASESVINGLRGVNVDVALIGSATCGKPYGFYPEDNCGQTYFSIQFQGLNDKNFGDYPDGFAPANSTSVYGTKIPGCSVLDDITHELGDPSEALLAAALNFRVNGTCPTPPVTSLSVARVREGEPMEATGRSEAAEILRTNRNLTRPGGRVVQ